MRTEGFPRVFGPYLLLSSLGRGGMGEVFLAKRHAVGDVDRLCIVKTLRGDLAEHREYVRRFLDEARIVVQLHHAHICQVFETQLVGSEHCLAMEYVAGVNAKDLAADLVHAGQRLDPGLALFLISCVLDALAFAHRFKSPITGEHLRVVHRDVSPANVMIGFDGDVKLIDFGLAESTLKTEQTETRLVMGKVAYMSPEQARGEEVDGSVDQFAAGVMLYELVTGDRFYGEMNTHQIWQVVGRGGHVPRRWLEVPDTMRNLLARALDPVAAQRFPSCDALRDAVDELRARAYPRANKGQLRELMQRLYGDRAEAERDVIASFADLRAPVAGLPGGNAPELSMSNRVELATADTQRSSVVRGTEPWRNSPSSSDIPMASGVVGQAVARGAPAGSSPAGSSPDVTARGSAPDGATPDVTATAPIVRRPPAARPAEPTSASDAAALRPSRLPLVLVGAALSALALVGAYLYGRPAAPREADAGVLAVAPADAGRTASSVVDAGLVAAAVTDAGIADAGAVIATPTPPDPRRRPQDRPREPRELTPPPPPPPPPPPAPPAPPPAGVPDVLPARSMDENLRIVRACKRQCVPGALALYEKNPDKPDAAAVVLGRCADSCVANGMK